MKKIISLLLSLVIIQFLVGCKDLIELPEPPFHSENFSCEILDEDSIAIGNLSNSYDKEYIFVPDKINNYSVKKLGYTLLSGYFNLNSQRILKRIYLPNTIEYMQYNFLDTSYDLNFFYCGEIINLGSSYATLNHIQFFVPNDLYEEFYNLMEESKECLFRANVSYLLNYDTDKKYYYVDNYEYGDKIEYIPPNPIRENYEFLGWYKDEECAIEWDFNNDRIPLLQEEAYVETSLYAKWEKIQ